MDKVLISLEQLARLTGKDAKGLGESLFEKTGESEVQRSDAEKTIGDLFQVKFKSLVDEHRKRGERETWEKVEGLTKEMDAEFTPTEGQGIETLKTFVARQKEKAAKTAGTLSEADLEKNELVKGYVTKHTAKAKELLDQTKAELERLKGEYSTNEKRTIARSKLLATIPAETFQGDDETERTRKINVLYELLDNRLSNLELTEGKDFRVLKKPGEVWTDDSLNPIGYEAFIQTFNPFPAKAGGSGNGSPGGQTSVTGTSGNIKVISKADYDKQIAAAKTADERAAINGAYSDFLVKSEGQQ